MDSVTKLEAKIKKTLKSMDKGEHLMNSVVDICAQCIINKSTINNEAEGAKFTLNALMELEKLGFSKKEATRIFKATIMGFKNLDTNDLKTG
ncbi:MAG: hypothetical protein ACOCRK_02980 [bacterium]